MKQDTSYLPQTAFQQEYDGFKDSGPHTNLTGGKNVKILSVTRFCLERQANDRCYRVKIAATNYRTMQGVY